jgi:hypothetical protein
MKILVKLPTDRTQEGQVYLDGSLMGRGRGKADNQEAAKHGNANRDPRKPYGDHPAGRSVIFEVRTCAAAEAHSYGPFKLCIRAVEGDVKIREDAEPGWDGLEAHGGDPQADGVSLRATYGCLRLPNNVCKALASEVSAALARGEEVEYIVENV